MKNELLLLVIVVSAVFLVAGMQGPPEPAGFVENATVSNYSNVFFSYEIVRYPSGVEISQEDVLGFVTDSWNLNFGVNPGNGSYTTRTIELSNKEESNVEVILRSYGNISPMIVFGKNDFVLEPGEMVPIDIFLYSGNHEPGNYSGEIDIVVKKPIYNFLSIN